MSCALVAPQCKGMGTPSPDGAALVLHARGLMRLLWLVLFALLGALVVNRLGRSSAGAGTSTPAAPTRGEVSPRVPGVPVRAAPVASAPAASTSGGTPVIERLARAEARRRIQWAGSAVYLDSAFSSPDSVLQRWDERPEVRIAVQPWADNPALIAEVSAAIREWRVPGIGVALTETTDTTGAQVIVDWVKSFGGAMVGPDSAGRTGLTRLETSPHGAILHAGVTLAVADPGGRPLSAAQVRAIAMHEIGHALGLPHSGDPGDVMYPTVRRPVLSTRDRSTASLLYALPPGSLREPGMP